MNINKPLIKRVKIYKNKTLMYLMELCPICVNNEAKYFTECKHSYCIQCLCRINSCFICCKPLIRSYLCDEIKLNPYKKCGFLKGPERENIEEDKGFISVYSFALRPEDHIPHFVKPKDH